MQLPCRCHLPGPILCPAGPLDTVLRWGWAHRGRLKWLDSSAGAYVLARCPAGYKLRSTVTAPIIQKGQGRTWDIHTTIFPRIPHFPPRIADRTGWYFQSDFQFSVEPTIRTYIGNVPTQSMFFIRNFGSRGFCLACPKKTSGFFPRIFPGDFS